MIGRTLILVAAALGACAPMGTPRAALAHEEGSDHERSPVVVASASASRSVAPDQATVELSVRTEGPQAQGVSAENAKRMAKVLDALAKLGLAKDEMATGWYSVQPVYSEPRPGDTRFEPRIVGYAVSNSIVVKTQKLDLAGAIIEKGVEAGATGVGGVSFGLADDRTERSRVLAQAVAHAREDAQAAAVAAGMTLGAIRSIDIGGAPGSGPGPMPAYARMAAADASVAPPLVPGQVSVSASVVVTFELKAP